MNSHMQRKRYLNNPYNFSLVCVFFGLLSFANGKVLSIWKKQTQNLPLRDAIATGEAFGVLVIFLLTLSLFIIFFWNSFEYFGTVEISTEKLVFRAPFRKTRAFKYEEIKELGIDYGYVSGMKQFWIYVSKTPVPTKYTHNILRLPFSDQTMRIQYRKKVYDALLEAGPPNTFGKKLSRCYSVVRLHRIDE